MKIILPVDTESTGFPSKSKPLNAPSQPHLVSLSALQVFIDDDTAHIQQSMSKLVAPNGWEWDDSATSEDGAFKVHGLTMERCSGYGRSEKEILDEFLTLWAMDSLIIAHNLAFDAQMISIAIARYYGQGQVLDAWLAAEGDCTMNLSKPIIKAQTKPNAQTGKTRLKNPNLKEAYAYFTGEDLEEHHSANRDAVAVMEIWFGLQETLGKE